MEKKDNKTESLFSIKFNTNHMLYVVLVGITISSICVIFAVAYLFSLDRAYRGKVYPRVFIDNQNLQGKTEEEIIKDWELKNTKYESIVFDLYLDEHIATISGKELQIGYDAQLIARQAYLVGRSGKILSDIYTKLLKKKTTITPYFRWDRSVLQETLDPLAEKINIDPQDALFEFKDGKVTAFKPAMPGKKLNISMTESQIEEALRDIQFSDKKHFPIYIVVDTIKPKITTEQTNTFGIKERIGVGYSEFTGSIEGRVHNIVLSAKKMHGVLIPPGEIISYNKIIGDISQATGWKPAYIIKDGRTVLGDGGGVCQGSTTLFRAALNAGLPILERQPHAYRVKYYELGGFKPGLDATVFAPSVDLRIKNDTQSHILIQAHTDTKNSILTVELFGTKDGRKAEILNHQILSEFPPPPPLYQEDPTLRKGVVKQVDWAAWGAKTVFTYKVTRGEEVLQDTQFVSNFRPWRAIYLVGTME
ncbi:MAG: VanW family protein [Patescibacteria group bacterium]|nr:VanW family protein [Patescibacteria group bacterium]